MMKFVKAIREKNIDQAQNLLSMIGQASYASREFNLGVLKLL